MPLNRGVTVAQGVPTLAPTEIEAFPSAIDVEPDPKSDHSHGRVEYWADGAAAQIVKRYLDDSGIVVLADQTLHDQSKPLRANTAEEAKIILAASPVDFDDVVDQVFLEGKAVGLKISRGEFAAALRQLSRRRAAERRKTLFTPLMFDRPSADQLAEAERQWFALAEAAFDMPSSLAVAILKHFIWQIYQRALQREVKHHLMPVIFSPVQGGGKTTFLHMFCRELWELASEAVLLSDFADKRSGDVYRYSAVKLDDMETIQGNDVAVLKQLITAEAIQRRKLTTSRMSKTRIMAVPIGTANEPINRLILDETGHRRFVTMPFRNGQVEKGGDPRVWVVIGQTDFGLLFRSVDPFGPSPILAHLTALFAYQGAAPRLQSDLLHWLSTLDRDSEAMRNITRQDGVPARSLYMSFVAATDSAMTETRFGLEMSKCMQDVDCPFADKVYDGRKVNVYRWKSVPPTDATPI